MILVTCGGEKKSVQCPFSGHQRHVLLISQLCVYVRLYVLSNTKQVSETMANQTAITCVWWLLCCVQVTLASTAPVWGLTDTLVQSSIDKPIDSEGMEKGAEACRQSPSLPVCVLLSLTNRTLPFCQSLSLAQSLDW